LKTIPYGLANIYGSTARGRPAAEEGAVVIKVGMKNYAWKNKTERFPPEIPSCDKLRDPAPDVSPIVTRGVMCLDDDNLVMRYLIIVIVGKPEQNTGLKSVDMVRWLIALHVNHCIESRRGIKSPWRLVAAGSNN
jgi:hypothetical protein